MFFSLGSLCCQGMNLEISSGKAAFRLQTRPQPKLSIGIGFGYHSSKNDFKVVRVWLDPSSSSSSSSSSINYEIFSSQQGLWREGRANTKASVDGFKSPTSCFLNGTVHWLVSTPPPPSGGGVQEDAYMYYSLLMFDCEREEFSTMELPGEINLFHATNSSKGSEQMTQLLKYSGMLSVLLYSKKGRRFELWVMKEHGVWTKLFNLSKSLSFFHGHVVMLREDGDFFGPSLDKLASYDPNQWIRSLGLKRFYRPLNAHVYEASMFLMEGGGNSYAKDEVVDIQLYHLQTDPTRMSMWRCPPVNWIKLNTRGAFKGNRNPAGAGGVFRDHEGRFVRAFALKMKGESAVKAQLKGLCEGLCLAGKMGIRSLIVELDAGEVVQAVTTSNSDLQTKQGGELILKCKSLIRGRDWGPGWRVGICHAPRQLNKVADWFAKTGMNQDAESVVFDDVPYEIEQFIANGK